MNSLIQLRGKLTPRSNPSRGGGNSLAANTEVKVEKLESIIRDLEKLEEYWKANNRSELIGGTLVNVEYNRVVPKSKRIQTILFKSSNENTSNLIKGAKYGGDEKKPYHIITYFIPAENLKFNIKKIKTCIEIIKGKFNNRIGNDNEKEIEKIDFSQYDISKTTFMRVIIDCSIVNKMTYPTYEGNINDSQAITLYDVNNKTKEILKKLGITGKELNFLDDNTIILYKDALSVLVRKAPYLISMAVEDISNYELPKEEKENGEDPLEIEEIAKRVALLPKPTNEPYIGVLDTAFDNRVYFHDWVEYDESYIDDLVTITDKDKEHGTAVDSIIVDGPSINPKLDDGCGRFKVKHFCMLRSNYESI